MNILFTCAGRRNYLLNYFREALNGAGKIVAADYSTSASAMEDADIAVSVPRVDDSQYIESICKIIEKFEIDLLISLNDLELPILAENKKKLSGLGCSVIVSDMDVINTCFDKMETVRFAKSIGVATPNTYTSLNSALNALDEGELQFPLVVKPRWGSSSIGLEFPEDREELKYGYFLLNHRLDRTILGKISMTDRDNAILIQNKIKGDEFGVDVINDLNGVNQSVIVKKKLAMRAGETDKAMTVHHPDLEEIGRKIGENLGHVANLDCDLFDDGSGNYYLLEMNPRFGGGYPFSHEAGANLPKAILHWVKNEKAPKSLFNVTKGLTFSKYDRLMKISSSNRRSL